MKKILIKTIIIALMSISSLSYGQDKLLGVLPLQDGKVTYTGVINVDSTSKDELYSRAKRWFVDKYNSGKDVIQLDDKENGEVIGKGFFSEIWYVNWAFSQKINVWTIVKIQVKDNKFRYEITNIDLKYHIDGQRGNSDYDTPIENWNVNNCGVGIYENKFESTKKEFYPKIDSHIKETIQSLETYMKIPNKSKSNW
jgi:hypothetical protein